VKTVKDREAALMHSYFIIGVVEMMLTSARKKGGK
jgi:hypothetical protein